MNKLKNRWVRKMMRVMTDNTRQEVEEMYDSMRTIQMLEKLIKKLEKQDSIESQNDTI